MARSLAEDDADDLPDVHDVPVSTGRVFLAGLSVAAAVMLIAEMFMALVLRRPELLLVAAPITLAFVLTAGVAVGWLAGRLSRSMTQLKASLVFFAAGLVAGGLWGVPVFTVLAQAAADGSGTEQNPLLVGLGALYMASTAGLGGLAGRWFGPFVATRPRLIAMAAGSVLLVAVAGFMILNGSGEL